MTISNSADSHSRRSLERLIEIHPGIQPLVSGSILAGPACLQRETPSWGANGEQVAAAGQFHVESCDGVPAIFLGRRTRNLLDRALAPFDKVSDIWRSAPVSLENAGLSFGRGSLRVDATRGPVVLTIPAIVRNPEMDVPFGGTAQVGVLYQLSGWARGSGRMTLRLRNRKRENEMSEQVFPLGEAWQRPCIALTYGLFEDRSIAGEIVIEGGVAWLDGLLLEPYVISNRTYDRAMQNPAPGAWVPGGVQRERDRFALPIRKGAIPKSGMIDFWFRPTWHSLHPAHTFFQMCHWYFTLELRGAGPILFAGQRPCEWQYYWEWARGQGYAADTWHHYAAVWREEGGVTLYLDGQSRTHAEQVPAHALNPDWLGETLVIGGTLDGTMELDSNVPGEMDAYLASWRMHSGHADARDVLLAMESTDPRPRRRSPPARMVFPVNRERYLIDRSKEFCWFPCAFSKMGDTLVARTGRGDDGGLPNLRNHFERRGVPSFKESHDQGKTWQASRFPAVDKAYELADGRIAFVPYSASGNPPGFEIVTRTTEGREERIQATMDMSGLGDWPPQEMSLALHTFMQLRDGSFRILAYTGYPREGGCSIVVAASDDLRRWKGIARPYKPRQGAADYTEPGGTELKDGRLIVMMRTGGWNERLAKGYSKDGGRTWTPSMPSGLHGISSTLRTLEDGTLLLTTGRPGIVMAVSTDGGETFDTCLCAEDDRIHEFSSHFGWYGYSSLNNGLVVDERVGKAYVTYDMVTERLPGDGTNMHACYIRPYELKRFPAYAGAVRAQLAPDAPGLVHRGRWETVAGAMAVTTETGAELSGLFEGTALVGLFETSAHAGTACVQIDDGEPFALPLYFPYRKVQRRLLADGLSNGKHSFRISLELGLDPQHKFANPEMAVLGGLQTIHMAGVDNSRRLAVYGFEVLNG